MANTLKPKGLSFDATKQLVRAAISQAHSIDVNRQWLYIEDIWPDGNVVYSISGGSESRTPQARTFSIDSNNNVTLSEAQKVIQQNSYQVVSFSAGEVDFEDVNFDGETVVKSAILFECGNYPDKKFSLSQLEADEIVIPAFAAGVPVEVEHVEGSVFSGVIGKTVKAWRDGNTIYGDIEWPVEVAKLLKGKKPKLSVGFAADKSPREISIVKTPRIKSAGVLSAFTEETEPERKGGMMSFFGTLAEKLGLTKAEVESGVKAEFSQITDPLEAKIKALETENAALKQGQSTFTAAQSASTATQIVEGFLLKGKLAPAEKDAAIAAFSKAIEADGGVQFAEGKQSYGGVTSALLATYEARPIIPQLGAGFSVVSSSTEGFKAQTPAEIYANRQGGKS